ncbi:MAG: hypothetical protein ABIG44_04890 [Planctomycetota bacterium]
MIAGPATLTILITVVVLFLIGVVLFRQSRRRSTSRPSERRQPTTKNCAHCQHDNPRRATYCAHCGRKLTESNS